MKKPTGSKGTRQARSKAQSNASDTSFHAQRQRIGEYLLRYGSATTIDLRERCNAMHPAGRIKEMRRIGWNIVTVWTHDTDAQGNAHRCARYVLKRSRRSA